MNSKTYYTHPFKAHSSSSWLVLVTSHSVISHYYRSHVKQSCPIIDAQIYPPRYKWHSKHITMVMQSIPLSYPPTLVDTLHKSDTWSFRKSPIFTNVINCHKYVTAHPLWFIDCRRWGIKILTGPQSPKRRPIESRPLPSPVL